MKPDIGRLPHPQKEIKDSSESGYNIIQSRALHLQMTSDMR
jgi:hypothetical protein